MIKTFLIIVLSIGTIACSKSEFHPAETPEQAHYQYLKKTMPANSVDSYHEGVCEKDLSESYSKVSEKDCFEVTDKESAEICLKSINTFLEEYGDFNCYIIQNEDWQLLTPEKTKKAQKFYEDYLKELN